MKNLNKILLLITIPFLVVIISCEDDDEKDIFPKPAILQVMPEEALIGAEVSITGEKFEEVEKVMFGRIEATDFTVTPNEIIAKVPQGLIEGETTISVFYAASTETNLGPSDNAEFNVLYPPELTAVSPESGVKPGFEVELTGDFLARTSVVKFGDLEASFEATQNNVVAIVPADSDPGEVQLSVTTPGGTTSMAFTILERTPEIYSFNPANGGKTGEEITVNGFFFMDVESVKIGDTEVENFEVVSSTEITFNIPEGVSTNNVTVTTALGEVTSQESLTVIEIPFVLYDEGLHVQMQNWGWGGNDVFDNTSVAKSGTQSYARTYNDGWSGIQLHHGSLDLSVYSAVKFSVYGGPGTTGKILIFNINWGASFEVELTEGEWKDFTVPLSDLGSPGLLDNLIFQDKGDTAPAAPFTVYLDEIVFIE